MRALSSSAKTQCRLRWATKLRFTGKAHCASHDCEWWRLTHVRFAAVREDIRFSHRGRRLVGGHRDVRRPSHRREAGTLDRSQRLVLVAAPPHTSGCGAHRCRSARSVPQERSRPETCSAHQQRRGAENEVRDLRVGELRLLGIGQVVPDEHDRIEPHQGPRPRLEMAKGQPEHV